MTLLERLAQVQAASNVSEAAIVVQPRVIEGGFSTNRYAKIDWILDSSADVALRQGAELFVRNAGQQNESAVWSGGIPAILQTQPKFLTSRTAGGWAALTVAQQFTAIQNFCNAVYKTKEASAGDIREFNVVPHDGSTIKVNGMFYVGASTAWKPMSWYVRLIDPNGSVASPYSNIEFHQISG